MPVATTDMLVIERGTTKYKTTAGDVANLPYHTITYVIDGGGQAITTGLKGFLEIPFACVIDRWTLLADQTGSAVVDIWRDTYGNAPPVGADSITASAKPTLSSAIKNQSTSLTGWTASIPADSVLGFNVDSVSGIQRLTLSLRVRKT